MTNLNMQREQSQHLNLARKSLLTTSNMLFLLLLMASVSRGQQCAHPTATSNHGHLDDFIYYGKFRQSQNSYFKFQNPFQGISNMTQMNIMFWARLPSYQSVGTQGTLLDCNNSIHIGFLQNGVLQVKVTQNITTKTVVKKTTTLKSNLTQLGLNQTLFPGNNQIFSQWSHFSINLASSQLQVFVNSVLVAQLTLTISAINTISNQCVVGNSLGLNDPAEMEMRHLLFLNQSFNTSAKISALANSLSLPNDNRVLAFFSFEKYFTFEDTYYRNLTRNYVQQGVTIEYSSESERVCYCSMSNPPFLQVSSGFQLNPLNLTNSSQLGTKTFSISFQILATAFNDQNVDQTIFSVINYMDVVLGNNGRNLKLNLYNQSQGVQKSVTFPQTFRFSFWTNYTIILTSSSAALLVDGVQENSQALSVQMPQVVGPQLLIGSTTLTYLLSTVLIYSSDSASPLFSFTFTQDKMASLNLTKIVNTGSLAFVGDVRLCSVGAMYSPANFLQGGTCYSSVNSAFLNTSSSANQLNATLWSTSQQITLEIWFKDTVNYDPTNKATFTLFENSVDNKTGYTQIALYENLGGSAANQRSIKITPALNNTKQFVIQPLSANNAVWFHLAVVSQPGQLQVILYNSGTQSVVSQTFANQSLGYTPNMARTFLGSSFAGNNKFFGVLRDFRIWNYARATQDINTYRFSSNIDVFRSTDQTSYNPSLVHYFRMDSGLYSNRMEDVSSGGSNYLAEKAQNSTSIQWVSDSQLVICQGDYYFDGTCCQQLDLSVVQYVFQYSPSGNTLMVELTLGSNDPVYSAIVGDFSLTNIGNDYDDNYTQSFLYPTFNQIGSLGFNVSSQLIMSEIYSLTLSVNIYSPYATTSKQLSKTVIINCPSFYLTLNGLPETSDDNYLVTSVPGHFIQIQANLIDNQCFNTSTQTVRPVNITKLVWSMSGTTPSFSTMFAVSSDNTTITQKQNVSNPLTRNVVQLQVFTNTSLNFTTFLVLNYFKVTIVNPITNSTSIMANIIQMSNLYFDFSGVQVQTALATVSNQPLFFQVTCPSQLFSSASEYSSMCQVDPQSYIFSLTIDPSILNFNYSYTYFFQFAIGIQNTTIMKQFSVNMTVFLDGSSLSTCPALVYNASYLFNKVNQTSFPILPTPYLACNGVFYEYVSSTWSALNQVSQKPLLNALNFSSANPLAVYLRSDNPVVYNLTGGSQVQIKASTSFVTANATSYTSQTKVVLQSSFVVVYQPTPLALRVVFYGPNRAAVDPSQIPFLLANFTIDGSSSFDPDNSTANLAFVWSCPSQIPSTVCSQMTSGKRNNQLTFTIWHKFAYGFLHNTNYTFTVTVFTPDNTYKAAVTQSLTVSFSPPTLNDVNIGMISTPCESLDIPYDSQVFENDPYLKFLSFTGLNYSNASFSIAVSTDRGDSTDPSSCGYGSLTDQVVVLYPGVLSNQTEPIYVSQTFNPNPVSNPETFQEQISQFPNSFGLPLYQVVEAIVYVFNRRSNTPQTFLSVLPLYIQKVRPPLIAKLVSTNVVVDKYATLTLDASLSYDQENKSVKAFTYQWSCPNNIPACASQTSSKLTLTYPQRANASANDPTNGPYTYSVNVFEPNTNNTSAVSATAQVTITVLPDYSTCISLAYEESMMASFDFAGNNNTLTLEYKQQVSEEFNFVVSATCSYVNLFQPVWAVQNPSFPFWTQDQSKDNMTLVVQSQYIQKMALNKTYPVLFHQNMTMGYDSQVYSLRSFVNFVVEPGELIPVIQGQQIFVVGVDTGISMDASQSIDPVGLNFTCSWDCPDYFDGAGCSDSCKYSGSFRDLRQTISPDSLSMYTGMSHQYTLYVDSADTVRESIVTYSIYLSDSTITPYYQQGIDNCAIVYQNLMGTPMKLPISQTNSFYLDCGNYTNIVDTFFSVYNYTWLVVGLNQTQDYYTLNRILYIRPYALAKAQSSSITIGFGPYVNVFGNSSNSSNSTNSTKTSNNSNNSNSSKATNGTRSLMSSGRTLHKSFELEDRTEGIKHPPKVTHSEDQEISFDRDLQGVQKYTNDTNWYEDFWFGSGILQIGDAEGSSDENVAYTGVYSISFENFDSNYNTQIFFQLRGYQPLYETYQVFVPIMAFTQDNVDNYYGNLSLPYITELYADFYTATFDYLGSLALNNTIDIMNMSEPYLEFNAFDDLLQPIAVKTYLDYQGDPNAYEDFKADIYQLLLLTEMVAENLIIQLSDIMVSNYAQQIISYLKLNFATMIEMYDPNFTIETAQARYSIETQVLMIVYNLVNMGQGLDQRVLSLVGILTACAQDYDELMAAAPDQDFLRYVVLTIQNAINVHLVSLDIQGKGQYFNQTAQVYSAIQSYDINEYNQSTLPVVPINTADSCRYIVRINSSSSGTLDLINNLNSGEFMYFPDETVLAALGIALLDVQFNPDTNASSAVSTALTINAYDQNLTYVPVTLDPTQGVSFDFDLQLKPSVVSMLQGSLSPNYTANCSYYDFSAGGWSTVGVYTGNYDPSTGQVQCQSFHLSVFSVITIPVDRNAKPPPNTNNSGAGNNTQNTTQQNTTQNNNTQQNNTNPQVNVTVLFNTSQTYYQQQTGYYVAAIVVPSVVVLILLIIALRTNYDDTKPSRIRRPVVAPYCHIVWAAAKIYHPLISAFTNQRAPDLAIPKVYQMLSLWIFAFAVALGSLIDILYIAGEDGFGSGNGIVFALVYLAGLLILRPIFNKLKYSLYHAETVVDFERQKNQGRKVIYSNSVTENVQLKNQEVGRRRFNPPQNENDFEIPDHGPQHYEGGDGDDGSDFIEDKDSFEESSNVGEMQHVEPPRDGSQSADSQDKLEALRSLRSSRGPKNQNDLVSSVPRMDDHYGMANQNSLKSSLGPKGVQISANFVSPNLLRQEPGQQDLELVKSGPNKPGGGMQASVLGQNHLSPQTHVQQNGIGIQIADYDSAGSPSESSKRSPAAMQGTIIAQSDKSSPKAKGYASQKKVRYQEDVIEIEQDIPVLLNNGPGPEMIKPKPAPVRNGYRPEPQRLDLRNGQAQQDFDQLDDINNHLDSRSPVRQEIAVKDIKVDIIQNSHNFKGRRLFLLILYFLILIGFMAVTFALMQQINTYDGVISWLATSFGVVLFLIIILDTILLMIFAGFYSCIKEPNNKCLMASSLLMLGSHDLRARQSLWLELN